MDHEETTTEVTDQNEADATEAETQTESERTFTQEEVEAIVKQRLDRERRKQKSSTKTKTRKKAQPKKQEAEEPSLDAGELRDQFYDAIYGRDFKLAHIKKMRSEFLRNPPDDPDAWVEEWAELVGLSSAEEEAEEADTEAETETKDTKAAKPVSDKPVANKGAPQSIPDYDTVIDPNRLDADSIRRMEQKYGKKEAWHKIRLMVERHYRGKPVRVPD